MKKLTTTLLLLCLMAAGYSQVKLDYSATPKVEAKGYSVKGLSAASAFFLHELQQVEATTDRAAKEALYAKLQSRYGIIQGNVSALLTLDADITPEELSAYGVLVNNSAGGIYTAMIPVHRFEELAASGLCESIDVGNQMKLHLENARENLGVNQIHAGMHLPQGYDGSGVVVGIIDAGFEYCHPTFYSADGSFRVKRAWDQRDSTGTPPTGYSYGSEYTTETEMQAARSDVSPQSHATHVAGIAAGSGAPSGHGATYRGIAPNADLVFVAVSMKEAEVLDAIAYIHRYAQSVGKPCVINMSFGTNIEPHDGTSEYDRFLSSFMAENSDSLVLVASAGNGGGGKAHLEKQFSPEDSLLISNLEFTHYMKLDGDVEIWSEKIFSTALTLINTATGTQEDFTGFFTTGAASDTMIETTLLSSDTTLFQCQIMLYPKSSYNNLYHTRFILNCDDYISNDYELMLTVRCDSVSNVHAWSEGVSFAHTNAVTESVDGDDNYTISGFGTNSDAVISVGSYITRLGFSSYNGYFISGGDATLGDISSFSSKGPTLDGRVKPDITAPGETIIAPYNRYATAGMNVLVDTIVWNDSIEKYGSMGGTSMSCPMVTGIVALWLQANPSLGVDSVRAILHGTARNDQFTGNVFASPSNTWGHGKVNAFGGLPTDTALFLITACPEEDGTGSVSGGGVVPAGTYTLTATPAQNYSFTAWGDGNTDNPRTVTISCDTVFLAVFNQTGYDDCDTIADFPWTATFDEDFTCWKRIDADGDGICWKKVPTSITSMVTGANVLTTDNWVVSPAVDVNQRLKVNITTRGMPVEGSLDFSLLLSTSGSETTDFSTVLNTYTFTAMEEKLISVSLDDYQGQIVRLALRHHNSTGISAILLVFDFTIEVVEDSVSVPSYADDSRYTLTTNGLQLNISNAESRALRIFDIAGRLIAHSSDANGSYRMPSAGLYIIDVNGCKPQKVVVKR